MNDIISCPGLFTMYMCFITTTAFKNMYILTRCTYLTGMISTTVNKTWVFGLY